MPPPDSSPRSSTPPFIGTLLLIGALGTLLIAVIAALIMLSVISYEVHTNLPMKIVIVAAMAAAALGIMTVLLLPRR